LRTFLIPFDLLWVIYIIGGMTMLIAINENNQSVLAVEANKSTRYFCSACQGNVTLKRGEIKLAHFAHLSKATCDAFSEGETEEHLKGKLGLYQSLENQGMTVQMEAYLPELKQRPDVLVTVNGMKIAIEFQCSPIPIDTIRSRTEGYLLNGYAVMWVLGKKLHVKTSLTAAHRAYLYKAGNQYVLHQYDSQNGRTHTLSGFHKKASRNVSFKSSFSKECPPLLCNHEVPVNDLSRIKDRSVSPKTLIKEKEKVRRLSLSRQESSRPFFEQLYLNRETIDSIPLPIFGHVPHEWLIQSSPYLWKYTMWKWLEEKPKTFVLTKHNLSRQLEVWLNENRLSYYYIPTLNREKQLLPFIEFAHDLTVGSYLYRLGEAKWKISQSR